MDFAEKPANAQTAATFAGMGNRLLTSRGRGEVRKTVPARARVLLAQKGFNIAPLNIDIHRPDLTTMGGVKQKRLSTEGEGRIQLILWEVSWLRVRIESKSL